MCLRGVVCTTGSLIHYPSSELVESSKGLAIAPRHFNLKSTLPDVRSGLTGLIGSQLFTHSAPLIHKAMKADGSFSSIVFADNLKKGPR